MKKIIALCIFCVFCAFLQNAPYNVYAATNGSIFAQIQKSGVFFFNSPIDEVAYHSFELPQTYFVELTGKAGDEKDLFYSARYMNVSGYVKKADVQPIIGTPIKPFASEINFRVFSPSGLDLKSTPSNQTPFNRIINVPYLCTDLIYYGSLEGDQMIPNKTSTWFYCKYVSGATTYFGYLYSDLCDSLTPLTQSTETFPPLNEELFVPEVLPSETPPSPIATLPSGAKVLAIGAICLPCAGLVYLLFKPSRLVNENAPESKKKISRLKRRAEFYELDD